MGSVGRPNPRDSDEFHEIIAVIRSLLTVRNQITTLRDLMHDYRSMEEEHIPFVKYGFPTLEDMLRYSGKFHLTRQAGGQTIVSTRLSSADEHMAKLVQETKSKSKSGPAKRMAQPPYRSQVHRPIQQQCYFRTPITRSCGSGMWQRNPTPIQYTRQPVPTTFHRPQAPVAYRSPAPVAFRPPAQVAFRPPAPVPNRSQAPVYNRLPTPPASSQSNFSWTPLPESEMKRQPIAQHVRNVASNASQPKPPQPTAGTSSLTVTISNEPRKQPPTENRVVQAPASSPRPLRTVQERHPLSHQLPQEDLREKLNRSRNKQNSMTYCSGPRVSVQGRLTVSRPDDATHTSDSGVSSSNQRSTIPNVEGNLESLCLTPSRDPLADLFAFCDEHNIEEPRLEVYARKVVGCRLSVAQKTFFEYGTNEDVARRKVAQTCLAHLKITLRRKAYPEINIDKHELATRLHDLLLQFPRGVMEKNLPEFFQTATGFSLPADWTNIVAAYTKFFVVDSGLHAHVMYANVLPEEEEEQEVDSEGGLALPWSDRHWNLFVTHVVSTNMIWARIIGPEFSACLDTLMSEIEATMKKEAAAQKKITAPEVEVMYLVQQQSTWYRVRCQEVDAEGSRCLVVFLDHGMEQWVTNGCLFECAPKFQLLPGQAALFTMFGLESMADNPHAHSILVGALQEKSVVAEIRCQSEDLGEGEAIKAVFYDTSSEEDVNLVESLHEEICHAGQAPKLSGSGLNQVRITSISDRGDLYCQMPGTGITYVKKMIDILVQKKGALALHQGLRENAGSGDSATRYLVLDPSTSTWFRAVLKVRHPQSDMHKMYCIDAGAQVEVPEANIHHLEPLSKALACYPALAIRCELHDVPKMDARTVSRLKGLLEPNTMALAKVMVSSLLDRVPQINVYQRLEAEGTKKVIVCVNDTLRLEHDFESSFSG